MTLSVETLLVVSLMMAVFAAVSTVGVSLFLGAGFERLRAGFETIRRQTAFFSEAIRKIDTRVDSVEKQGTYFFQAISALEQKAAAAEIAAAGFDADKALPADLPDITPDLVDEKLIYASKDDADHAGTDNLLTYAGFIMEPAPYATKPGEPVATTAERTYFH